MAMSDSPDDYDDFGWASWDDDEEQFPYDEADYDSEDDEESDDR